MASHLIVSYHSDCIISYFIGSYYTVLYCRVLYNMTLYATVLYCIALFCIMSCCVKSDHIVLGHTGRNQADWSSCDRQLILPITFELSPPLSQTFSVFLDVPGCHFSNLFGFLRH